MGNIHPFWNIFTRFSLVCDLSLSLLSSLLVFLFLCLHSFLIFFTQKCSSIPVIDPLRKQLVCFLTAEEGGMHLRGFVPSPHMDPPFVCVCVFEHDDQWTGNSQGWSAATHVYVHHMCVFVCLDACLNIFKVERCWDSVWTELCALSVCFIRKVFFLSLCLSRSLTEAVVGPNYSASLYSCFPASLRLILNKKWGFCNVSRIYFNNAVEVKVKLDKLYGLPESRWMSCV